MPTYAYTVAEHDPLKPWVVVGKIQRYEIELEAGENFFQWAAQAWPKSRYEVTLDPWQISPEKP